MPATMRRDEAQLEGSVQMAIIAVLQAILREGLRHRALNGTVPAELLTSTVAWAIFGAANTWAGAPEKDSAEHMAEVIDRLVSPVLQVAAVTTAEVGEKSHR
jgi:hypothetical protein